MPTDAAGCSGEHRPTISACNSSACNSEPTETDGAAPRVAAAQLAERMIAVLAAHHVSRPAPATVASFARELDARVQARKVWLRYLHRRSGWGDMDILGFIGAAKRVGDHDEALWRAFLAGHFGRASADDRGRDSAGRFLCGFGTEPRWTWEQVSTHTAEFSRWLDERKGILATLRYGNHRKFESKRPDDIMAVVRGFVAWARSRGAGPVAAFTTSPTLSPAQRFRALYDAFAVHRFGRTGRFDFLCLIRDMALLPTAAQIEPGSCYIPGSTGPRQGIELLCGRRDVADLSAITDDLARALSVAYDVMEDALCIWQKAGHERVRPARLLRQR